MEEGRQRKGGEKGGEGEEEEREEGKYGAGGHDVNISFLIHNAIRCQGH